jgi:hypothetical protein
LRAGTSSVPKFCRILPVVRETQLFGNAAIAPVHHEGCQEQNDPNTWSVVVITSVMPHLGPVAIVGLCLILQSLQ